LATGVPKAKAFHVAKAEKDKNISIKLAQIGVYFWMQQPRRE